MEKEGSPEVYEIIAWLGKKDFSYCPDCGDRDELYQPLYKDDFLPGQIITCIRCGKLIRGKMVAGLRDDNLFFCSDCANQFADVPLAEQDLLTGEKVVCHRCGKVIQG
jgi:DNA-directed RNA polymerase subunit RPC12/RpoP